MIIDSSLQSEKYDTILRILVPRMYNLLVAGLARKAPKSESGVLL